MSHDDVAAGDTTEHHPFNQQIEVVEVQGQLIGGLDCVDKSSVPINWHS